MTAGFHTSAAGDAPAPGGRRELHWEATGEGPPVLLIMGLGLSGGAWWRTVPVLARHFRVITFDNRGVGRSHSLTYSFTTEAMADDAATVLDAAGIGEAHVYGISLGGMVAQQLALRHPERVSSLVLGATHGGGRRAVPPGDEVVDFFRRRLTLPQEEATWASVPYNYGPACRRRHAGRIAEDVAQRLAHPFPAGAYRAQLYAARLHNCLSRLSRVKAPTMIVHGRHDRLIPVKNAYLMAERMPQARLEILAQSGHLYPTEQPEVDDRIAAFMADPVPAHARR
ncbi:MAG TPA: alpha/beta hydrolase [Solirubrobacteraceae bacterium]|nr:alpha/beta hydrolase [Solirubrobacteraceae bacterium]